MKKKILIILCVIIALCGGVGIYNHFEQNAKNEEFQKMEGVPEEILHIKGIETYVDKNRLSFL